MMAETVVDGQPGENWRDASSLTRWVIRLLYAQIFMGAVSVASGIFEFRLLQRFATGLYYSREQVMADAHANDLRQEYITLVSAAIFILTAAFILRWIYVSYRNASSLGNTKLRHTPTMAVTWYFVPVANLWKPYQVMKELWTTAVTCGRSELANTPKHLVVWWGLWLVSGTLGILAMRLGLESHNLGDLLFTSATTIASDVAGIPLSMMFMAIVKEISNSLDNCHSGVAAAGL